MENRINAKDINWAVPSNWNPTQVKLMQSWVINDLLVTIPKTLRFYKLVTYTYHFDDQVNDCLENVHTFHFSLANPKEYPGDSLFQEILKELGNNPFQDNGLDDQMLFKVSPNRTYLVIILRATC